MSLSIHQLTVFKQNNEPLFDPIDLSINSGEIVSLMGPSGCGKSTLLSVIAGLLDKDFYYQGTVLLDSFDITALPAHQRSIGILFQDDLLFPHLSVWENIAFALPDTFKGDSRRQEALADLESVSLLSIANSMPDQISGGQRARVSMLRTLAARPKALLLDEPFGKLDQKLRAEFRHWVFEQVNKANIPTLMVTHDPSDISENSRCLTWPWSH